MEEVRSEADQRISIPAVSIEIEKKKNKNMALIYCIFFFFFTDLTEGLLCEIEFQGVL